MLDEWFRQLLPRPFEWLDARFGRPDSGDFHWVLLRKDHSNLFIVERTPTTGAHVSAAKGTAGRKYTDHFVRIAARHVIPPSAYTNWDKAIELALCGEAKVDKGLIQRRSKTDKAVKVEADDDRDISYKAPKAMDPDTESEVESIIFTSSRKPVQVTYGRRKLQSNFSDSDVQSISDNDDTELSFSARNSAKARKRIDSSKTSTSNEDINVQVKRQKVIAVSPSPPRDIHQSTVSWDDLAIFDGTDYAGSFGGWDGQFDNIIPLSQSPSSSSNIVTGPGGNFPVKFLDTEASMSTTLLPSESSHTTKDLLPTRRGFNIPGKPQHNPWA